VDALAELLWRQPRQLQLEAARALGSIGPDAKTVLRDLLLLLRLYEDDRKMGKALARALRKIVPEPFKVNSRRSFHHDKCLSHTGSMSCPPRHS
jgi:hypothetical protein